jgi:hypothetical protein
MLPYEKWSIFCGKAETLACNAGFLVSGRDYGGGGGIGVKSNDLKIPRIL